MPRPKKPDENPQKLVFDSFEEAFRIRNRLAKSPRNRYGLYEVVRGSKTEYILARSETHAFANVGQREIQKIRKIRTDTLKEYLRLCDKIEELEEFIRRKEAYLRKWNDKRHELDDETIGLLSTLERDIDLYARKIQQLRSVRRKMSATLGFVYPTSIEPENMEQELLKQYKPAPPPIAPKDSTHG